MKEGWYVVTETRTLDGYKLDNAPRNVEVASDKLNLVEYRNQPYPHLQLVKIDAKTKAPLFVLFSISGFTEELEKLAASRKDILLQS